VVLWGPGILKKEPHVVRSVVACAVVVSTCFIQLSALIFKARMSEASFPTSPASGAALS
jgi:hypothetical protein